MVCVWGEGQGTPLRGVSPLSPSHPAGQNLNCPLLSPLSPYPCLSHTSSPETTITPFFFSASLRRCHCFLLLSTVCPVSSPVRDMTASRHAGNPTRGASASKSIVCRMSDAS